MTITRPSPTDTISVINSIVQFINNSYPTITGSPILDPLLDAGLTRGTDTGLAVYKDEVRISQFPKITFEVTNPGEITKLSQGKNNYREKQTHEFMIIYTCNKSHTWTYPAVDGTAYVGKQQCIKYLQYLRNKIKKYSGSFENFNEIVVGPISDVVTNKNVMNYSAAMSVKIDTYGGNVD